MAKSYLSYGRSGEKPTGSSGRQSDGVKVTRKKRWFEITIPVTDVRAKRGTPHRLMKDMATLKVQKYKKSRCHLASE